MKNEKKFLIPEAEIISFTIEDIITASAGDGDMGGTGESEDLIP